MDRTMQRVRRLRIFALAAGAALALGTQLPGLANAQDCLADVSATGDSFRNFTPTSCGGLTVRISVPDTCTAGQSCGLITALNGITVPNEVTARNDDLERLGREQGFVVLRAQGPINPLLAVGGAPALRPQDTNTIIDLIEEAQRKLNLDPNRLHVAGFSQGAGAAIAIACRRPDLIGSIAVIAPAGGLAPGCGQTGLPVRGMFFTQSSIDGLVPAARTRGTVNALIRGMGLTQTDGVVLENGAMNSKITRFMSPEGDVLEFFEHNFGGATFGDGHCYPGSFEGPVPLADVTQAELDRLAAMGLTQADVVGDFQFACDDDDVIRIGERMAKFFIDNQRR
jgi:poly(3-hydroxybutyrate) depolymerase